MEQRAVTSMEYVQVGRTQILIVFQVRKAFFFLCRLGKFTGEKERNKGRRLSYKCHNLNILYK